MESEWPASRSPSPSMAAAAGSSSYHPFAYSRPGSSEGMLVEQSPAVRSNQATSDAHSDVFSWRDDASESLATGSAADQTITVNTQRMRMGEHLKGKLQCIIRERFEDYLRIVHVLQNDIGKVAALECELGDPFCEGRAAPAPARVSITCGEDCTFLVYMAPDTAAAPCGPGGFGSSCSLQEDGVGALLGNPGDHISPEDDSLPLHVEQLARGWVEQVCSFGMNGRCHSLTALFDFGYTEWKKMLGSRALNARLSGVSAGGALGAASAAAAGARGHIAEEDERPCESREKEAQEHNPPLSCEEAGPSASSEEPRSLATVLKAAQLAVDCEQYQQALDLCSEGLAVVEPWQRRSPDAPDASGGGSAAGSGGVVGSSAAASAASALVFPAGVAPPRSVCQNASADGDTDADTAAAAVHQILLLRANVQALLRNYKLALRDAEELIFLQPTCAEGYYWQSVALQGMGRGQEALEALMSALEYDPQNPLFQQAFTALFEEISASSQAVSARLGRRGADDQPAATVLQRRSGRGGHLGDALSTTTQATHLSSRSTTPTEVSAAPSRSSSNDSLYVIGEHTEQDSR